MHLPAETWTEILRLVWEERYFDQTGLPDNSDLARIVRTSRSLYMAGIPFLYRHCMPKFPKESLLSTLKTNQFAASCVRHWTIYIPSEPSHQYEGGPLSSQDAKLAEMLSSSLECLSNLTSLRISVIKPRIDDEVFCQYSETWAKAIFPASTQLPFRLKAFSTNFGWTPSLSNFISSQQSLRTIHLWPLTILDTDANDGETTNAIRLPSSLKSIAFTNIEGLYNFPGPIPQFMQATSLVEDLVLDLDEDGWLVEEEDYEFPLEGIQPFLGRLKGLTLSGIWYEGMAEVLRQFAPVLSSLEFLCVTPTDSPKSYSPSDCLNKLLDIAKELPSLKTVMYDMEEFAESLEEWLSQQPAIPDSPRFYVGIYDMDDYITRTSNVELYNNPATGSWSYRRIPMLAMPNRFGSRITFDRHYSCDFDAALNTYIESDLY